MELTVSSGFYIRQFCNDFGKYIGGDCGAIAFDITRLKII
jgi:tRNA U55 pseudouridine synthase TruB